jgi:hypothetical protein
VTKWYSYSWDISKTISFSCPPPPVSSPPHMELVHMAHFTFHHRSLLYLSAWLPHGKMAGRGELRAWWRSQAVAADSWGDCGLWAKSMALDPAAPSLSSQVQRAWAAAGPNSRCEGHWRARVATSYCCDERVADSSYRWRYTGKLRFRKHSMSLKITIFVKYSWYHMRKLRKIDNVLNT